MLCFTTWLCSPAARIGAVASGATLPVNGRRSQPLERKGRTPAFESSLGEQWIDAVIACLPACLRELAKKR